MQDGASGIENTGTNAPDSLGGLTTLPPLRFSALRQSPAVDLIDEGRSIRILVDLPGVSNSDIFVHVGRRSVSVLTSNPADRAGRYYYRERAVAGYYKSIPMPTEVEVDGAKANFSNGMLDITVRKHTY